MRGEIPILMSPTMTESRSTRFYGGPGYPEDHAAQYRASLISVVKQAQVDLGETLGTGEDAVVVPVKCALALTSEKLSRIDQKSQSGEALSGGDKLHLAVLNALTANDQAAVREGRLAITTPDHNHIEQLRLERVAGK